MEIVPQSLKVQTQDLKWYRQVTVRTDEGSKVMRLHSARAVRALGKPLPEKACVHHHGTEARYNQPDDCVLVICQDQSYHKLLHMRTRILRAGGDPNTQAICRICRKVKGLGEFSASRIQRRNFECRPCSGEQRRARWLLKRGDAPLRPSYLKVRSDRTW